MLSPHSYLAMMPIPMPPENRLTFREREITEMIAYHAATNKEIASELGIAVSTVKNHLTTTFFKLNVESRAQLMVYVLRGGAL